MAPACKGKDEFFLKPQGKAMTDVIIKIPKDKEYYGKKFQAYIFSYTKGGLVSVGLKSKLFLSIKKRGNLFHRFWKSLKRRVAVPTNKEESRWINRDRSPTETK